MLSNFRECLKSQDKGVPFELFGMTFMIRRGGAKFNDAIVDCKRHLFGVYYSDVSLSHEDHQKAVGMAIAEYLVASWKGVVNDETGEEVKHSISSAKEIFMNAEYYNSLNPIIVAFSNNYENYLYKKLTEDEEKIKKQ